MTTRITVHTVSHEVSVEETEAGRTTLHHVPIDTVRDFHIHSGNYLKVMEKRPSIHSSDAGG